MNIFHKVTLKTLKENRVRTIVTIIGIILSAAMICAVTTFAASFRGYMLDAQIYDNGDWYGMAQSVDEEKIGEITKDGRLTQIARMQMIGYADAGDGMNEYKPYLYIAGGDQTFFETMPIHLLEGRLPTNSGEILLPKHLETNGGINYSLGDTLTLEIGERIFEGESITQNMPYLEEEEELVISETREYTVVGFYERPSFEDYSASGYTALTVMDTDADGSLYDIYFKTKDAKEIYDFMEEHELGVSTNSMVLAFSGAYRYDSFYTVMYGLATVVIVLIMFGSISLIYNAFAISVSERTKQFGLLSSVGATKKQLKRTVIFEALFVSIIGIPIGILSGIGGIGVTLYLLRDKISVVSGFDIPMELTISWFSVVSACVIAFVTVLISAWIPSKRATRITAIDAIRQTKDITTKAKKVKTSKLTYKLFGLEGMIAKKYFKRSKKKYRATVISLFMSIVLFISASSLCTYLTDSVEGGFRTYNYDLYLNYVETEEGLSAEEAYAILKSAQGVTAASSVDTYSQTLRLALEDCSEDYIKLMEHDAENVSVAAGDGSNMIAEGGGTVRSQATLCFVEDAVYEAFLKENDLDTAKFMDAETPVAVVYDNTTEFDYSQEKYVTYARMKRQPTFVERLDYKEIEGHGLWYIDYFDEDGKVKEVCIYLNNDTGEELRIPIEEAMELSEIAVGGFVDSVPLGVSASFAVMYPYSVREAVLGDEVRTDSFEMFFTSSDHSATYKEMNRIADENGFGRFYLEDYAEYADENRSIVTVINVFAYGFITLISLIAAANVFNTISTNISLRRRDFAMLKSVGMTHRGFNRMMNFECVLYGVRSLVIGLPAAAAVTYWIYRSVNEGYVTKFYLPWTSIVIAVLSVFAVVFATMMYSMQKIKRDNPIDALKNENL